MSLEAYCFYVGDDRYTVDSLLFVNTGNDDRARELARAKLNESDHYVSVTVWKGDVRLFALDKGSPPDAAVSADQPGALRGRSAIRN